MTSELANIESMHNKIWLYSAGINGRLGFSEEKITKLEETEVETI